MFRAMAWAAFAPADDEVTREITRLNAEVARLSAQGDEELRELLMAKVELIHYLAVKDARKKVAQAQAQLAEALKNKDRDEDALHDWLTKRACARIIAAHTKPGGLLARAEECSEDSAAPETKTKRKRASD